MASNRGNRNFSSLPIFLFCCTLWTSYLNEGKEISFYKQGDDVIFEGGSLQMVCAYSSEDVSNVSLTISGKEHIPFNLLSERNDTSTQTLVLIPSFSGNDTFVCTVESDQNTETTSLPIVAIPREFPYCTSNSSNEIIEGDGILLSCYADEKTMDIKWVTNTSNVTQTGKTLLSTTTKKEAVIRPFENETGIIYTCKVPSSKNNMSECSVGPINVYKAIVLNIQPKSTDSIRLHPGESHELRCSSITKAVITWNISNTPKSVDTVVKGQSVKISVHSNNTDKDNVNLTCVGNFNNHIASRVVNVQILQAVVNRPEMPINFPYFVSGGVAAVLIIALLVVLCVCCIKHRTKSEEDDSDIHFIPSFPTTESPVSAYVNATDIVNSTHSKNDFNSPPIYRNEGANEKTTKEQYSYTLVTKIDIGNKQAALQASENNEVGLYSGIDKGGRRLSQENEGDKQNENHAQIIRPESSAYANVNKDNKGNDVLKGSNRKHTSEKGDVDKRRITIRESLIDDEYFDYENGQIKG